jgi:hypothetical protein
MAPAFSQPATPCCIDGGEPALLAIHPGHGSDEPLEVLKYRVATFGPRALNELVKDAPPDRCDVSERDDTDC